MTIHLPISKPVERKTQKLVVVCTISFGGACFEDSEATKTAMANRLRELVLRMKIGNENLEALQMASGKASRLKAGLIGAYLTTTREIQTQLEQSPLHFLQQITRILRNQITAGNWTTV